MATEATEGYNIRFRHVSGDFGPYLFPKTCTVLSLKEKVMEEWPKVVGTQASVAGTTGSGAADAGPSPSPSQPAPKSAAELRIIFGGRMLDNQKLVKELQHSMGNPQGPGKMVTMHVVVRQPAEDKGPASGNRRRKGQGSSCCVVQ